MDVFSGRISSSGFSSGDRIVIGDWEDSPLGSFTNIMLARPDGSRVLISPSEKHAEYVSKLYNFEEVRILDLVVTRDKKSIQIEGTGLSVKMSWGVALAIPIWRPLWFIATVENLFAKILYGTKTYGLTKDGRREWYSIRSISRVSSTEAIFDGKNFGDSEEFEISACFGFSEPPRKPSSVSLKSYID